MKLRCISLWQPWASAIALGLKTIETRGWVARYTGPLAIHAAQKKSRLHRQDYERFLDEHHQFAAAFGEQHYGELPRGAVLCIVQMRQCVTITRANTATLSRLEKALGTYTPGREAWMFEDARRLIEPFPCSGRQGFFWVNVPDKLIPAAAQDLCAQPTK